MVTLERLRDFLALPENEREDLILESCLSAARSKARTAGIPDYQDNAQYDLFLCALAAMYYDNRGMGQIGAEDAAQRMINSFVLELRYAEEDYVDQ